ncbi:MAG: IS3 family transposase, partial [Dehalococcoidia bacterium]|nr:IS3 family transposase [Dehalococcoidia bacterium]
MPRELEVAIGRFVDFYNYRRYHKALKDITPADMLAGRQNEILGRRGEVKDRTINRRKLSNHVLSEQL